MNLGRGSRQLQKSLYFCLLPCRYLILIDPHGRAQLFLAGGDSKYCHLLEGEPGIVFTQLLAMSA